MATYPAAVRWSTAGQDYDIDADGRHEPTHPVDAAVAIRLGWRKGTIAGDPETGHTLHLVDTSQSAEQRQRDIEDRQRASLGSLLTDGLVEIVSIEHDWGNHGRLTVVTTYRNLVTSKIDTVTSG